MSSLPVTAPLHADAGQLRIVTSADVVCADGVDLVEAVVIRHARTGCLWVVTASAFVSCDGWSHSARAPTTNVNQEGVDLRLGVT